MQQNLKTIKRQWVELFTLSGLHMTVDMFSGMLAVLLPVIRENYALSLTLGVILLSVQSLACNVVQLLVGHLRAGKKKPLLIPVGLCLATLLCFIGVLPQQASAVIWIFVLAIISGIGVAIFHPESLRAVHYLKAIPASTSSAVYLTFGFMGFTGGSWFAAVLVSVWGLKGLLALILFPILLWVIFKGLKTQLAVEDSGSTTNVQEKSSQHSIWSIYVMLLPAGISSAVMMSLLPSRLYELGYSLTYGGLANMMIGIGAVAGSLILAYLASNGRELFYVIIAAFITIPFFLLYLFWMEQAAAIGLLLPYGFFAMALFPLIVSLARHARGVNLGFRMGLICGGIWGAAHIVLMGLSPIAEKFGIQTILNFIWIGYLISAFIGIILYRKSLRCSMLADEDEIPSTRPIACFTDTMIAEEQELK
jgi:FSR family fosmidomycin resistance protein-like MFS transporter